MLDIERQIADRIRGEAESQGVRDARIRLADVEHHFATERTQLALRFRGGEVSREQFDEQARELRSQLDDETIHLRAKLDQQRAFGDLIRAQNEERLAAAQQDLEDAQAHADIVAERVEATQAALIVELEQLAEAAALYQAELDIATARIEIERIGNDAALDSVGRRLGVLDTIKQRELEIASIRGANRQAARSGNPNAVATGGSQTIVVQTMLDGRQIAESVTTTQQQTLNRGDELGFN